jgi:hypothetical protein
MTSANKSAAHEYAWAVNDERWERARHMVLVSWLSRGFQLLLICNASDWLKFMTAMSSTHGDDEPV